MPKIVISSDGRSFQILTPTENRGSEPSINWPQIELAISGTYYPKKSIRFDFRVDIHNHLSQSSTIIQVSVQQVLINNIRSREQIPFFMSYMLIFSTF